MAHDVHTPWHEKLSDEALIAAHTEALDAAHNAPSDPQSFAWARRSREASIRGMEMKRRGITKDTHDAD